ncbi:MAG: type I-F CRISPR-associated endoribonuclease Cas6/Csy4 [Desulfuromonadaceae bacterium]|nr:type I-F CRISPR-associated endoribonuclease Cas6/Csy4 [Desulfuromonadaceae bacterium]
MKYYQDVTLLRDARIDLYDFWQKLYQQIHIALAENKNGDSTSSIGVSFPEYNAAEFSLGIKLRLFAEGVDALEKFKCEQWLSRLIDYVHIGKIMPVPETVQGYACFRQVKTKGSNEKLARRRAKRLGINYADALAYFKDTNTRKTSENKHSKLPYIHMHSETNGHQFRLFIDLKIEDQEKPGTFSCYGLSNASTVPMF